MKQFTVIVLFLALAFSAFAEEAVELSVRERILLSQFLPAKAGLLEAIIVNDLRKKITLTQEEIEEHQGITNSEADLLIQEFTLTTLEVDMLKKGLKKLDNSKKVLTDDAFINLCNKIKNLE